MPSFASSQDGLDEAQSPSSCASRYQFDGAFSKTSSRVTLEPLTRLAKLSFRQRGVYDEAFRCVSPEARETPCTFDVATISPYTAYTDDFGNGNTGSCVLMLVGQTTEICSPAFCITTGVERSFWPESGVPGR